ncbi:23S rRNA (uracil-5-)-methyltransferase RumA [Budvicia aquatica]|uniref:23S rRNA (Uracil-5-)-methyltransferase RumA n=1 Tax=Budvicia aquatica TaxID=82979 RepID=A0A484ZNU4_9GAMM|nr:class I SAM-dependent methyltransferase [Budvicia aquatica]VFS50104.1 23S rRNA (uracil-5-)-methyltransferase RumA [Budvicia aquatica]
MLPCIKTIWLKPGGWTKPASSWDAKAEKMAESCANPEDEYLKKFLSMMDLTGAETLLDIGCGPGTICLQVADRLKHVYGLDLQRRYVSSCPTQS